MANYKSFWKPKWTARGRWNETEYEVVKNWTLRNVRARRREVEDGSMESLLLTNGGVLQMEKSVTIEMVVEVGGSEADENDMGVVGSGYGVEVVPSALGDSDLHTADSRLFSVGAKAYDIALARIREVLDFNKTSPEVRGVSGDPFLTSLLPDRGPCLYSDHIEPDVSSSSPDRGPCLYSDHIESDDDSSPPDRGPCLYSDHVNSDDSSSLQRAGTCARTRGGRRLMFQKAPASCGTIDNNDVQGCGNNDGEGGDVGDSEETTVVAAGAASRGKKRPNKSPKSLAKKMQKTQNKKGQAQVVSLWNGSGSVKRKKKDLTEFDVCLTIYNDIIRELLDSASSQEVQSALSESRELTHEYLLTEISDIQCAQDLENEIEKEKSRSCRLQQELVSSYSELCSATGAFQVAMQGAKKAEKMNKLKEEIQSQLAQLQPQIAKLKDNIS